MDVNGSRFHLFVNGDDWGRCRLGDEGAGGLLSELWVGASPPAGGSPPPVRYDAVRGEFALREILDTFVAAPGDAPVTLEMRRGAAADRYGNIYWIGGDRRSLLVRSVGSQRSSIFWPANAADRAEGLTLSACDFNPPPSAMPVPRHYTALTVTEDHYLVVGWRSDDTAPGSASAGLIAFDLMAGGPPTDITWPAKVPFAPFDMAARPCGGVWVLDREHRTLWEFDRQLKVVSTDQPSLALAPEEEELFQPVVGAIRKRAAINFPGGVALDTGWTHVPGDPVAIEVANDGGVLVLDRQPQPISSRVLRYCLHGSNVGVTEVATGLALVHDFVFVPASAKTGSSARLYIATAQGNQAYAFAVTSNGGFGLAPVNEFLPMRRFGGKALVVAVGPVQQVQYDFAATWIPLMPQRRARYVTNAEMVTPVLDSGEPGCRWHRVLLDACLPSDTGIEFWSRVADEPPPAGDPTAGLIAEWSPEPSPYLRSSGPELPWMRVDAQRVTRASDGIGTWELLLQHAAGRYVQLRILLTGNGRATPRLRALRIWYPRSSYLERFLPGAYREDETSASFLERFLANFEGTLTALEDRMANVQALFDPRSAPGDALDWLSQWFDVALDPAWDERRQRLFIRHASTFFAWRGTVHGLETALHLAFDAQIDEARLSAPDSDSAPESDIRIVEACRTRRLSPVVLGDAGNQAGPQIVDPLQPWTPAEGNGALVERYARSLGKSASGEEQLIPFTLYAPAGDATVPWVTFVRQVLGFVPSIAAQERDAWQGFLIGRHASVEAVNALYGTTYASISGVDLPRDWPDDPNSTSAVDWRRFVAASAGTASALERERWQHFLARRYRRVQSLNLAHSTNWPSFDVVAFPDHLPATQAAQVDWLQFEREVGAMQRTAHRFSVLLPVATVVEDADVLQGRLDLASRIVTLEKPAHTTFDVRFYWALFRIGEARLGIDTLLGVGSRAPELVPGAVLGRAYIGASFVAGATRPIDSDRLLMEC